MSQPSRWGSLSFDKLINIYVTKQQSVVALVNEVAKDSSTATPGKFLLLQFAMSQVTQIGDSISNLLSQVNSAISNSIRNQKSS